MFIQQTVRHEKDRYISGTYVVCSNDPEYKAEVRGYGKRSGYINFYYDVQENRLDFEFFYCQKYAQKNYQELVETIWHKIRLIRSYWKSVDYSYRSPEA